MLRADIKFANGSIIRCKGRIINGESVPWKDEADLKAHIDYINEQNPDLPQPVEIVAIIYDEMPSERP